MFRGTVDSAYVEQCSVLVTGGSGFLGRHLVKRLLSERRNVTILGRTPAPELETLGANFIRASLEDTAAVRAACAGMSTVYHIAAKVGVWGRYDDFYRINVLGTRALLEGSREHGVRQFVYTSSPSVVYNGYDFCGASERVPLTTSCPSPYPLTKAIAEREVIAANTATLHTVALRPHLIWGIDDPHLVPRMLDRARRGRLFIVGSGKNRVDLVHVENAVDAHILAEYALMYDDSIAAGRSYFITNNQPVVLWDWINDLLQRLGEPPVRRKISADTAAAIGLACELIWRLFRLRSEPPMTRFIAEQLSSAHWFTMDAARGDLGYRPRVSMAEGMAELVAHLKASRAALPLRKA